MPSYDPFLLLLQAHGFPAPEREVLFARTRRFRADYLWREPKVIVEQEGGLFSSARAARLAHAAPLHVLRDMEKGNLAQALGYRYFRFTPEQLHRGDALAVLGPIFGRWDHALVGIPASRPTDARPHAHATPVNPKEDPMSRPETPEQLPTPPPRTDPVPPPTDRPGRPHPDQDLPGEGRPEVTPRPGGPGGPRPAQPA